MSDAAKELIGYALMFIVLLGILRLTCTPNRKRGTVAPIRKEGGGDAA